MHESRCRKRVVRPLSGQSLLSRPAKLLIHKRQKLSFGCRIALASSIHQQRHIGLTV